MLLDSRFRGNDIKKEVGNDIKKRRGNDGGMGRRCFIERVTHRLVCCVQLGDKELRVTGFPNRSGITLKKGA